MCNAKLLKRVACCPTHARISMACLLFLALCFAPLSAVAQFDFPQGLGGGRGGKQGEVRVEAEFTPPTDTRPAILFVTARIDKGFHVYAVDQQGLPDGGGGPLATSIEFESNGVLARVGDWQPTTAPDTHVDQEIWAGLELREHGGKVSWFAPIEFAEGVNLEEVKIRGTVVGQSCNPHTCIPFEESFTARLGDGVRLPKEVDFSKFEAGESEAADGGTAGEKAAPSATFAPERTRPSATTFDLARLSVEETETGSLTYYLISAFIGGLILNIMPCVLPVIGLKVMSFVQQAGQSRTQALILNCWYASGIIAVFLILASLAVSLQLGWGGQFGSATFNVTLIAIVFAMALSLLGLWEIPIPGFVGSGAAMNYAEREGPTGAFLKGILTTLLATPCTGPFMATALAWSISQPAWVTYLVFGVLGLGMASPYLLIGAFPNLIRFLPRPGAWMETFKKVMGLVLLATVVWLLTFISPPLVVPTVAMMVGIAAACWWVSQTPVTAPLGQKVYAWVVAGMLTGIAAMGSFGWLYQDVMLPRFEEDIAEYAEREIGMERLAIAERLHALDSLDAKDELARLLMADALGDGDEPWQPFSLAKLQRKAVEEGRTVLVEFTADWCLTCKTLEKVVLKTDEVESALEHGFVVTMTADYTHRPDEIERTIKALGGNGVPLIAIFPASKPHVPITFQGQYTRQGLLDAIAEATGQRSPGVTPTGTALSQADPDDSRL